MLPTCCRQIVLAALACAGLAGCSAAGEATGDRTFSDDDVPFTFRVPAEFIEASIDQFDSRGDVVAAVGIDKLDVIAVRRLARGVSVPRGDVAHEVQGRSVVSRLHVVRVRSERWAIECQWQAESRDDVLDACATAVDSISRR